MLSFNCMQLETCIKVGSCYLFYYIFCNEKKNHYFKNKYLASRKRSAILINQNSLYVGLLPSSTSWSSVRTRMMFGRMFLRSLWNLPFRRWFNRKAELPSNSDKTVIMNNPRTRLCCAILFWFSVLSEQGRLMASTSFLFAGLL